MTDYVKRELRKKKMATVKRMHFIGKLCYYTGVTTIKFHQKYNDENRYVLEENIRRWHPFAWVLLLFFALLYFIEGLYTFFTVDIREVFEPVGSTVVFINNDENGSDKD